MNEKHTLKGFPEQRQGLKNINDDHLQGSQTFIRLCAEAYYKPLVTEDLINSNIIEHEMYWIVSNYNEMYNSGRCDLKSRDLEKQSKYRDPHHTEGNLKSSSVQDGQICFNYNPI